MAKTIYSADYECFVKVLGRIRTDAGLSQEQLSEKMKLSQSTISDILRGQRRLDVIEWITFCRACNVTPDAFLEELTALMKGK